jgi:hypothetical protein
MRQVYFIFWMALIIFLGLGAFIGGGMLILDPTGDTIKLPLEILEYTPFNNFLIPGILLFVSFGLTPLLLVYPLLRQSYSIFFDGFNVMTDMHWAWTFVIYIALALIIWIQVQMEMLREILWIHSFYTFYAILMIVFALLPGVRLKYKR